MGGTSWIATVTHLDVVEAAVVAAADAVVAE